MSVLTLYLTHKRQIEDEISEHWPDVDITYKRERVEITSNDLFDLEQILDHLIDLDIFDPSEHDYALEE